MKKARPSLNDLINKNKEELFNNKERLELIELKVEEKYVNSHRTTSHKER